VYKHDCLGRRDQCRPTPTSRSSPAPGRPKRPCPPQPPAGLSPPPQLPASRCVPAGSPSATPPGRSGRLPAKQRNREKDRGQCRDMAKRQRGARSAGAMGKNQGGRRVTKNRTEVHKNGQKRSLTADQLPSTSSSNPFEPPTKRWSWVLCGAQLTSHQVPKPYRRRGRVLTPLPPCTSTRWSSSWRFVEGPNNPPHVPP